jgi:hypothetical protein
MKLWRVCEATEVTLYQLRGLLVCCHTLMPNKGTRASVASLRPQCPWLVAPFELCAKLRVVALRRIVR